MIPKENITGIILAGGKSSRMGTDKGFLLWDDRPFVEYSIRALQPLVSEIIIVSDHLQYDQLGYKRINDIYKEAGPLSGLYSGLKESKNELNLVLSCDLPLITSKVLQRVLFFYEERTEAVVCKVDDRLMPLVALYHKDCCKQCEMLLKSGKRKMMQLVNELNIVKYVPLDIKQQKEVANINNQEDLNRITNAS